MSEAVERLKKAKGEIEAGENQGPKYRVIFQTLRDSILSGEYRAGARLPSEADLVRRFEVSRMTVVKAFRELQQQGLVVRRVGSGTFASSRGDAGNRLFGLLIPELGQTEIFEPICQGMASVSNSGQHSLLWGNAAKDRPKEQVAEQLCHQYIAQHVSGVFFAPLELTSTKDEVNQRIVAALDRARIPIVLLDRCFAPYPQRGGYDLVGIDNQRTAYLATEHLAKAGAKRIAFLGKQFSASTVDARVSGYREALLDLGLWGGEEMVTRGDPADESLIRSVLDAQRPDAFLCANDHTAANLMQTLLRIGRRIPDDIRIVGIDDVKYAGLLPIPLTTLHQPCEGLGHVAISTMLSRLEDPELPPRDILLNCRLVVRESCGSRSLEKS